MNCAVDYVEPQLDTKGDRKQAIKGVGRGTSTHQPGKDSTTQRSRKQGKEYQPGKDSAARWNRAQRTMSHRRSVLRNMESREQKDRKRDNSARGARPRIWTTEQKGWP
mmetsp:Transcript_9287/g.19559  ORF Transcript_9287/g.19559 Transcript_9287/m.19559 type:complete len:108 (-) Transcript_9287:159-482(-)